MTRTPRTTLFFLLLIVSIPVVGLSQEYIARKDLKAEWMVYENNRYEPFLHQEDASAIYFWIDGETFAADKLYIKSYKEVAVFINGQLAASGHTFLLSVDSLAKTFATSNLLVGIFTESHPAKYLTTQIASLPSQTLHEQPIPLRLTSFRDFVILATLLLAIMLVVITRLNPKLASDYLSFKKILSVREADEAKIHTRLTSSTNILFYVYCSLLISFYLLIVFQFVSNKYPVGLIFQSERFDDALINWLVLSAIVLIILLIKILLVFSFSFAFGIKEVAGIHFFNLVRMLLIFFGTLTAGLFVYFISRGYDETVHAYMLKILGWIMAGWMILIFLKLSGKMSASMFHLFSYICATELIPLLIIVKVLYN